MKLIKILKTNTSIYRWQTALQRSKLIAKFYSWLQWNEVLSEGNRNHRDVIVMDDVGTGCSGGRLRKESQG